MDCVDKNDDQKLVAAFKIALNSYNPYRRTDDPRQDSFWQIIEVGNKLGMLGEDFKAAHDVTDSDIISWERRGRLPPQRQRGQIHQSLKAVIGHKNPA